VGPNVLYLGTDEVIYPAGGVVVVLDPHGNEQDAGHPGAHSQRVFMGHGSAEVRRRSSISSVVITIIIIIVIIIISSSIIPPPA
jgi:hypothetical protein